MKRFEWDERKNAVLKRNRGVSFEDALLEISEGRLLNMMENASHPGQIIYVVRLNGYIHCVPAIEDKNFIRLITIYPSRKLNSEFKGRL
jgi:uncharacterized DUF497 family protein